MSFSNYLSSNLLDHVFGSGTYTPPSSGYIALTTGLGATFDEPPAGSGYARVAVDNNKTTWSTATVADPSVVSNNISLTFPQATGGGWGTIQGVGVYDSGTGGNLLCSGALTSTQAVNSNETPEFTSGNLSITLT